jgi:hypothetical protein
VLSQAGAPLSWTSERLRARKAAANEASLSERSEQWTRRERRRSFLRERRRSRRIQSARCASSKAKQNRLGKREAAAIAVGPVAA